jgi:hypothetical protein
MAPITFTCQESPGNYSALFAVKKLANELGGLDQVESAVQVLKQLGQ